MCSKPDQCSVGRSATVSAITVTGLVLVNVGINAAFFGPINVFIGQQAISFDEASKEAILSLAVACVWRWARCGRRS